MHTPRILSFVALGSRPPVRYPHGGLHVFKAYRRKEARAFLEPLFLQRSGGARGISWSPFVGFVRLKSRHVTLPDYPSACFV